MAGVFVDLSTDTMRFEDRLSSRRPAGIAITSSKKAVISTLFGCITSTLLMHSR